MSTLTIQTFNDWYLAIGDSWLATPVYSTYLLAAPLTFTSTNPPVLSPTTVPAGNGGVSRTDYLYISAGKTFDGQGYLLYLQNGCQPANGIGGIFRAVGSSGNTANFFNVNIQAAPGLPWNLNGYGSIFISNFTNASYSPNYVNVQNAVFQAATDTNIGPNGPITNISITATWVSGQLATNITMNNVYMHLDATLTTGSFFNVFGSTAAAYQGPSSFTNCVFSCSSLPENSRIMFCPASGSAASTTVSLTNCYFYFPNQTVSSPTIYLLENSYANVSMTNAYVVLNTYSSTPSNAMTMVNVQGTATCTLTNVYTNNTTFTTTGTTIPTNVNTSFTFSSAPSFSDPADWIFNNNGPSRLTAFTVSPFVASAYTTFDAIPQFLSSIPCLCRGMTIDTPDGPVPVESLKQGDLVLVPPFHDRAVPILHLFYETCTGSPDTVPYRIPSHFFEDNIPTQEILLSPHHAVFYDGKWRLPVETEGLFPVVSLIGKEFEYFHVHLPDYRADKLWCHNLPVDSWDFPALSKI